MFNEIMNNGKKRHTKSSWKVFRASASATYNFAKNVALYTYGDFKKLLNMLTAMAPQTMDKKFFTLSIPITDRLYDE